MPGLNDQDQLYIEEERQDNQGTVNVGAGSAEVELLTQIKPQLCDLKGKVKAILLHASIH